jgi:hypothetical protein
VPIDGCFRFVSPGNRRSASGQLRSFQRARRKVGPGSNPSFVGEARGGRAVAEAAKRAVAYEVRNDNETLRS